jgi:hypothetical protein
MKSWAALSFPDSCLIAISCCALPIQVLCVDLLGHAFIQNIRRGHYELGTEEPVNRRVAAAFSELALAI